MKRSYGPKKSLFARILFQLTIPLIALGGVITALQVGNQIQALNELHKMESRWVFEGVRSELSSELAKPGMSENAAAIEKLLQKKAMDLSLEEITLWDLWNRRLVSGKSWKETDLKQAEKSLYMQKQGEPYVIFVNKEAKRLSAYIPLKGAGENDLFVARASFSLNDIKTALHRSRTSLTFLMLLILIAGTVIGINLSNSIIKPILILKNASHAITQGELGKQVHIRTDDEIQLLADTFNEMSNSMRLMRQKAADSNPLTGLPGNKAIFEELEKRIFERQKFVIFHSDLDRFKIFNDHYGLAKGDDAIKGTAELLVKCVRERGALDDFVGHEGGDDFVILTRPHKAAALGELICSTFDKELVKKLYSSEDFERGYTLQEDRRGTAPGQAPAMVKFPLLGISLAGVSNAKKDWGSHVEYMKAAVDIKKIVKKNNKSSYMVQE